MRHFKRVFNTSVLNFTSGKRLLKVQIISIEELLNGKKIEYPTVGAEVNFKKAQGREKGTKPEQMELS